MKAGKKTLKHQVTREIIEEQPRSKRVLSAKVEKSRARNKSYVMDLLIHSPAALGYIGIDGIDTAPALIRLAKVKGIDVLGITDYYEANFIDRLRIAAEGSAVTIIPGVNMRCSLGSCNDIRLSCFFPENFGSKEITEFLSELRIPTVAHGNHRYVVNNSLSEILHVTENMQGFVLPTRIDRTPARQSIIAELVEEYGFRTFEVAYLEESLQMFKQRWPKLKFNLFSFSNASALAQVGSRIAKVKMPNAGFCSIRELAERQDQNG